MISENVTLELRPDTMQLSFHNLESVALDIEIFKFEDGSLKVSIPEMKKEYNHMICDISANIKSMNDLIIVAQVKEIIERFDKNRFFRLNILSTAYTRYDRVMHKDGTDAFGAKVFANFVNSIEFNFVNLYDSHSNVMLDLINNSNDYSQDSLLRNVLEKNNLIPSDFNLIAPDKGATKKLTDPDMVFDKVRVPETGKIVGMTLAFDDSNPKKDYLVVDDICEGGRTFIEVAKLFNETKTGSLNLYVTHGIFSNNAIEKLLDFYDNIFVYFTSSETLDSLNPEQRKRVKVANVLN